MTARALVRPAEAVARWRRVWTGWRLRGPSGAAGRFGVAYICPRCNLVRRRCARGAAPQSESRAVPAASKCIPLARPWSVAGRPRP
eukprot:scaffold74056_cov72-Phaeocystis_antarctica.AAC.2